MEILLRNGETIKLDWNPIVLEYLEEYDGGLEQLKEDVENENIRFRTFNYILYCAISAVYPRELTYREAVALVDIKDLDRIIEFIVSNINNLGLTNTKIKQNLKKHKI